MRSSVEYSTVSKNNYIRFCKEHPETEISFEDWKNIQYTFTDLFREHLLETGEKGKFPAGIGQFSVVKRKRKKIRTFNGKEIINLPIDWKKTKAKGKHIYNFNHKTNGYSFRWMWFKESSIFKHARYFRFKPSRLSSRLIAHYLNIDEKYQHIYLEWELLRNKQ